MIMKKLILSLAVCLCALTVSAQEKWAVGGRIGSGFQAQAEYHMGDQYLEGRFGMSWCNSGATLVADFTALYNWNICTMDWTPKAGQWFFDAGAGLSVGGKEHYAYVGAAGQAKFGIKFKGAPVKLAIDWTPVIGPHFAYAKGMDTYTKFNSYGLANFGISCVYCF